MQRQLAISKYQFAVFRIILGVYLSFHFAQLISYAAEMFSRQGVLPNANLNLTYGLFPNLLAVWDSPLFVTVFVSTLFVLSGLLVVGVWRRTVSFLLWYGWACLFHRNNLINNPSLPYIGFILLSFVIIPKGEPLAFKGKPIKDWQFPSLIYAVAWFLLATGYTFSGCFKLQSPSWIDGTAMMHLVNNPLARPGIFRDLFLSLPNILIQISTWITLAAEILFLPLSFHRTTRMIAWTSMLLIHLGILTMVNFADLTLGMIMIHLFTFDPSWLTSKKENSLVLFDGVCGLCDKTIQILLDEDHDNVLKFAPLQGETAKAILGQAPISSSLKSIVFIENYNQKNQKIFFQSDAVLRIFHQTGGFPRVISWLSIIPRWARDKVYDFIARHRYQWFGQYSECRIPDLHTRQKFLP